VTTAGSYLSSSDKRVHFGLGATEKIDFVQVRWPTGLVERFENLPVNAIHDLKEGTGTAVSAKKP